jgi:hypothetical protein
MERGRARRSPGSERLSIAPPVMFVTMRALRLTVTLPAVWMSTVLAVIALALLPSAMGLGGFLIGVVMLSALFLGRLEELTVRTLGGAREPGTSESAVLAPLMTRLDGLGISVEDLYLARAQRSRRPAMLLGRRSLVVSRWLVEATDHGELSQDEAAALVVHAVGGTERDRSASSWP